MKKLLTMILSFALLLGAAVPVSAAEETLVIKKTGEYTVNMDKGDTVCKLKFKAPSAGSYRFNFSNIHFDGEYDIEEDPANPYWAKTSSKYDRVLKIKATKGKKTLVNKKLPNQHKVFSLVKNGSGSKFNNLLDIAYEYMNLQDTDVAKWTKGYSPQRVEFTVKLKKGETVNFTFTGDKKDSVTDFTIEK